MIFPDHCQNDANLISKLRERFVLFLYTFNSIKPYSATLIPDSVDQCSYLTDLN